MKFKRQPKSEIHINVTSFVDILFVLLLFFIVSSVFSDKRELAVALPKATGQPQLQLPESITVVVSAAGEYTVNGKALLNNKFDTLKAAVSQVAAGDVKRPFVITADANTSHQSVVQVMDVAGQLGFVNLSMTSIQQDK